MAEEYAFEARIEFTAADPQQAERVRWAAVEAAKAAVKGEGATVTSAGHGLLTPQSRRRPRSRRVGG